VSFSQALYTLLVELFKIGWYCSHDDCETARDEFSYFTILTYWGLGFYFLVSSVHTFTYARTGNALLDRLPRPLQALHAAFYTTIVTYPFIVTAVYWGVLYSGTWFTETFNAWSNVSQHAMNTGFALFEIIFTRTNPPPMVHMLWLIIVLALYLALAYLTRATKGFYVYDFLDPGKKGSGVTAGYILGIAVAAIVAFWLAWGLIWLRRYVSETRCGRDGKFADEPTAWRGQGGAADPDLEMSGLRESSHKADSA
jgi:hypothetical protein